LAATKVGAAAILEQQYIFSHLGHIRNSISSSIRATGKFNQIGSIGSSSISSIRAEVKFSQIDGISSIRSSSKCSVNLKASVTVAAVDI
jgi:hypothetical protein